MNKRSNVSGFTIFELLVVIVVIGILAAITIVAYTGISQKAITATMQSDLDGASRQLKLFQVSDDNGNYPSTIDCTIPDSATNKCVKKTSTAYSYVYTPSNGTNPKSFILDETNGTITYRITDSTSPVAVVGLSCPTGFIVVPGSATYGTSDFCVMKYEARNAGGNVPVSQPTGTPWVTIAEDAGGGIGARFYSANVAGCTGCHLITEAEWLTIAQNVLNVGSNWSTGTVGSGYIYSGHSDGLPSNPQAASADDNDGYYLTGNTAADATIRNGMVGKSQRRTLTLSNGAVIWDLSGNAEEWTSSTVQTPVIQPGIAVNAYAFREWTSITNAGTLPINPSATTTGITGSASWNSTNGIGLINSNSFDTIRKGFTRGGSFGWGNACGVLGLDLSNNVVYTDSAIGFRVTK